MNLMKRIFAILLVLIMFLSGCAKNSANPKIVTFWTLQMGDFAPYINSIIQNYENEHKNIRIKWVDVPFSEGEKRLKEIPF